ncbi:MAG TPA: hypothetical protein DCQ06_08740 [Myxococcales bacterium]|nr:hypothetical protein [Myxococcales bacterium]
MPPPSQPTHRLNWADLGLVVCLVAASLGLGFGLSSSNDGSHVALARALSQGRVELQQDRDLTLRVDVAVREGVSYSDRPPGTAALATPALWIGQRFDASWAQTTQKSGVLVVWPARKKYAGTYAARLRDGPALITLQASALAASSHARLMSAVGLLLMLWLLARKGIAATPRRVTVAALAFCSLWGPYSVMLFNHVSAATLLLATWCIALDSQSNRRIWLVLGGVVGAMCVATDYLLVLAVVPMVALHCKPTRWWWWLLGAAPVALAVAWYHQLAFGNPWATGYSFQSNFAFARSLGSTFDRSPLHGFWILFGSGRDAGLLAQAPLWLLGLLGLWRQPRIALPWFAWLLAICTHHTPWGGGTMDHRYIVPLLPLAALGLARVLSSSVNGRRRIALGAVTAALALYSSSRVWSHLFEWRGL